MRFRLFLNLLIALPASLALAHDPLEITALVREKSKWIEVTIEMQRDTAASALARAKVDAFPIEDFPSWEPRLVAAAPDFLVVSSAGSPIAYASIAVELTREDHVAIRYRAERPSAGETLLSASILEQLPDLGYGVDLRIVTRNGAWMEPIALKRASPSANLPD